jgi:hypothetical protein
MNKYPIEIQEESREYLTGVELINAATFKDDDEDVEYYVASNDKDGSPIKMPEDEYSFNMVMYSKKTGERQNE